MDRLLFIVIGSTGVSQRSRHLDRLVEKNYVHGAARVVPSTTRRPRPGEEYGVDFHFPSPELFKMQKTQGGLIEYVNYGLHRYGINLILLRRQLDFSRLLFAETNQRGAKMLAEALEGVCRVHASTLPIGDIDRIEKELDRLLV